MPSLPNMFWKPCGRLAHALAAAGRQSIDCLSRLFAPAYYLREEWGLLRAQERSGYYVAPGAGIVGSTTRRTVASAGSSKVDISDGHEPCNRGVWLQAGINKLLLGLPVKSALAVTTQADVTRFRPELSACCSVIEGVH